MMLQQPESGQGRLSSLSAARKTQAGTPRPAKNVVRKEMRGGGVDTVLIVYFRQIEDVRTRHTKATIATKPSRKPASAFCFGADTLCGNITANRPAGRLDARCKDPGGREPSPQGGGSGCGESGRGLLLGEASGRKGQHLLT